MRPILPAILAMAVIVLASNILVQVPLGDLLTWGAVTYPIAFLVTDVTNRVQGAGSARRVVVAGFVIGVGFSLVAAGLGTTTLRIAIASGTGFLLSQLLDVWVFDRLRHRDWWQAPFLSSLVGSAVDTALFFSLAFSAALPADPNTGWANEAMPLLGMGSAAPVWVSLALADWMVKLMLVVLALVPFRVLVRKILSVPARSY